jgi:hypothetical protein
MGFKKLSVILGIFIGALALFAGYKVIKLELFPWLNAFIACTLSFLAFLLSFLVKKTKSSIKIVLSVFFISQLISNFIILNSPNLLLHHWRWLFYPLIALVFILFVAFIQRKEQRVRTLLFGLLLLTVATTIIAIKTPSTFASVSQIVLLVICSLGILFSRNAEVKLKE